MPNTERGSLELEIRRIDLLYRQNIAGLIAIFANTIAYIIVTWNHLPKTFTVPWFIILNASALVRFFAYYRWRRSMPSLRRMEDTKPWLYFMYASLLVSGCGWGAIGWVSPEGPVVQQGLTALLISCMTAGAMITYVSSRIAMGCVIIPAMIPWSLGFFLSGEDFSILVGCLIALYTFLMVMIGKNLNVAIMNSLTLDAALRKNQERLRMSMESSEALTWDWDLLADQFYWEGNISLFPGGQDELRQLLKGALERESDVDAEYIIRDRRGAFHYIAVRGKFYRDEGDTKPFRFAGICWDVTTKKNEEILRRERDLHEAANHAKSVFLANASHEIRTPLAAILGFTEALLGDSTLSDQSRKDVRSIHRQGNYMVSLVNDLLDLSKIETNRLYIQKAPMNLVREIEDSISVVKALAEEKKLSLKVNYKTLIPETVQADSVRFRQVLINLLTNAVKFTGAGSVTVEISFSSDAQNEGVLKIQVSDTGLGMDHVTQENLFQPFVRGEDPEVQRVQGSGLGLALSLSLMRMMGGDLRLVSTRPGDGSTFEMILNVGPMKDLRLVPADQPKVLPKEIVKVAKEKAFLQGQRVLVVDDSSDLRALMTRYLSREGAQVETAENGAEAVERAMGHPYDIILMDIKMPVMDGYKATTILRERGYQKPIVALTAQASVDGQQKSFEMGFDGYLSKPVDMMLLKEILRNNKTNFRAGNPAEH